MGISPPLDTTLADGDTGHEADHSHIATYLNALFGISSSTPQPVGSGGAAGATGNVSDAGHVHAGIVLASSLPLSASKVPSAGAAGLGSDAGHVHPTRLWQPGDNGLLTASDDPSRVNSQNVLGFGNLLLIRMRAGAGFTIANIEYGINVIGSSLSGGNFVGAYSLAGVRLGVSADQAANFASSSSLNGRAVALTPDATGSLTIAPGDEFFGAILANGTGTGPTWWRIGSNNVASNYKLAGAALRFGQIAGPMSVMPASFTPSSMTSTSSYWLGAS